MIIKISIPNFDKYNERKDRVNFRWFKLYNDFFTDPKIFSLSPLNRNIYLYLLAQRSKTSEEQFDINTILGASIIGIKRKSFENGLNIIIDLGLATSTENRLDKIRLDKIRLDKIPARSKMVKESSDSLTLTEPKIDLWEIYSKAYESRYRTKPIRNAMVNSQMKNIEKRLGNSLAANVLEFYLNHNAAWYIQQAHSVGAALRDAEKLATELNTGKKITQTGARQAELEQNNLQALKEVEEIYGK